MVGGNELSGKQRRAAMTWIRGLKYVVALGLLGGVVWWAEPGELWRHLQDVDYAPVLLALLLDLPGIAAVVARSALVIRRLGYRVPGRVFVPTTLLGYAAGALTPAASGEVLRAAVLRSRAGVPVEEGVALVVYERALSLYLLALSTGVFLVVANASLAVGIVAGVAGLALVLLPWAAATALLPRLPAESQFEGTGLVSASLRYLLGTARHLRFLLADARLLAGWSLITLGVFAVSALQVHLLTAAVTNGLELDEAWVAFGGSQLAGMASMLPFGLGVADSSLAAILDGQGLTIEQAAAVVVLVRGVLTLPWVLVGFGSYFYLDRAAGALHEPEAASAT